MSRQEQNDHDNHEAAPLPECWTSGRAQELGFGITPADLYGLIESRDVSHLEEAGGIEKIAGKLLSDLTVGIPDTPSSGVNNEINVEYSEVESIRRLLYGVNRLETAPKKSFLRFILETLNDRMLIALCVAAVVQMGIGIYNLVDTDDYSGMSDGISIVLVVTLVVLITSINDYRKQGKFRQLSSHGASLNTLNVMRGGKTISILASDLAVGDILFIDSGMIVPVDGLLIEGIQLKMNESSVTGESGDVHKSVERDPFILSGTSVLEGHAKILVTAVGRHTLHGRVLLSLTVVPRKTPLQTKLASVAEIVAKVGLGVTTAFLTLLIIAYFSTSSSRSVAKNISKDIVEILLVCIAVVVIAIPEGLPLSVTLALAYAAMNMVKDKCLVRNLSSCETMGCSTSICTDKTGTLTMNTMDVTSCFFCGIHLGVNDKMQLTAPADLSDVGKSLIAMVCCAINANYSAKKLVQEGSDTQSTAYTGSRTEVALVKFTHSLGYPPFGENSNKCRIITMKPFSSLIKYSGVAFEPLDEALYSTVNSLNWPGETQYNTQLTLVCVAGAPEVALSACTHYIDLSGSIKPITEVQRADFAGILSDYASQALRTLAVTVKAIDSNLVGEDLEEFPYMSDLVMCALFGISDPLRPEVPKAISDCQRAGITVRMVTGDNIETARAISKNCGIIKDGDEIAIEGKDFRAMSTKDLRKIVPKIRVLARSSPMDKQKLVKLLQERGEVVAVTGDGSNDAPALKTSDIGFSIGVDSTDIAKHASDVVVLDGNFASVSKAILWGRSISNSIKNFLQFQLSVNVSAVLITMITTLITAFYTSKIESIFKVVQLLWINLIMDTLAALSLSTDKPTEALYDRKPAKLTESILTIEMRSMILVQAIYQVIACLSIYITALNSNDPGFRLFNSDGDTNKRIPTLIFNVFVLCQVFNEINCRSCTSYKNVFDKILKNRFFIPLQILIVTLQVIIVTFGGSVFGVEYGGLNLQDWLTSIGLGIVALPLGYAVRCIGIPTLTHRLLRRFRVSTESQIPIPSPEEEEDKHLLLTVSDQKPSPVQKTQAPSIKSILETTPDLSGALADTSAAEAAPEGVQPQVPMPVPDVGPGWQAARRLLLTIKILNTLGGGRLRNEEDLERELAESLMLSGDGGS